MRIVVLVRYSVNDIVHRSIRTTMPMTVPKIVRLFAHEGGLDLRTA